MSSTASSNMPLNGVLTAPASPQPTTEAAGSPVNAEVEIESNYKWILDDGLLRDE